MRWRPLLKWTVVLMFGAVVLLGNLLPALLSARVNTPRDRAVTDMKIFATAVAMYEEDTGYSPAAGLLGGADTVPVESRVLERLHPACSIRDAAIPGQKRYLRVLTDRLCVLGLLDPWGRPYRMAIRELPSQAGAQTPPVVIVMWSVGRNGRDENGAGDDIVEPRTRPARQP